MSADAMTSAAPMLESQFLDADGVRTHYLVAGAASAPPVVLVHGGGAGADSRGNWTGCIPALGQDFRIFAVDMVGFGLTEKPDPAGYEYSQANRTKHLIAFLEAAHAGPVSLVGNSMGGATSLGVAMERPDLVSKLVLMGSAGLNTQITPAMQPILGYDFTLEGMRRMIDGLTGSRFRASDDLIRIRHEASIAPETRRAYEKIMGWISAQGGFYYPEDKIAAVKTPTLIVNGKEDIVVPLACAYKFLELLENSWGYIVPHCGHWVMLEAPQEFASIVRRFLRETGARA